MLIPPRLLLSVASIALGSLPVFSTSNPTYYSHAMVRIANHSPNEWRTKGSRCIRLNLVRLIEGKKFKCLQTSRGLQWIQLRDSATKEPGSTTTTTVDLTPTDEVAKKIHKLLLAASTKEVVSSTKIEFLSEDPTYRSGEDSAKDGVNPALKIYTQLGFEIPKTVIVLFAKTESGIRTKLLAEGCTATALRTNFAFLSSTGSALLDSCNNDRVAVVIGPTSTWTRNQVSIDFQHTLPHELFHQWQLNSTLECGSWRCGNRDFPKWLFEGTPQVMARIAFWSWNKNRNYADWLEDWYTVYRASEKEMCRGVTIEEMVDPSAPWGRPGGCAYSKGQLAVEVLIANYGGFEALRNLHTTKTTAGLSGFAEHFQRVTGRSLNDFYAEVNSYFAVRNFP